MRLPRFIFIRSRRFLRRYFSKVLLKYEKSRYNHSLNPAPPASIRVATVVEELNKFGISILEGYELNPERLRKEAEEYLDKMKLGSLKLNSNYPRCETTGVYRIFDSENIAGLKRFFDDDFILDVARAYVSKDVVSYQRMTEGRYALGKKGGADDVHFDDWRKRFKAFLYLSDVGENGAPFVYYPGSHEGGWRYPKEVDYLKLGKDGEYGYFTDSEVEDISSKYECDKKVCVAKAGTLIFVDTRGLHSGTTPKMEGRTMLANYFDVRKPVNFFRVAT